MNKSVPALESLLELQERLQRGPKREGAFALWLVARQAWEQGLADGDIDRNERRRLGLLARRIAPLAVPAPLSRGLATALDHLDDGTPQAARIALSQLVAPAREAVGNEAGEAIATLVRDLHARRRQPAG